LRLIGCPTEDIAAKAEGKDRQVGLSQPPTEVGRRPALAAAP
jgi:hypothetical protein